MHCQYIRTLAGQMALSGIDELWIADITYIRLLREFIYLAVILDAFSRRCIGWGLERHLRAELALEALKMAIAARGVKDGLVHHSDRGVQYASADYTGLLEDSGIRISMSRRGNAYDNAKAEPFMRTLKYEEVYMNEYEDMREARERIGHFLEEVYNRKRLHSAWATYRQRSSSSRFFQPIHLNWLCQLRDAVHPSSFPSQLNLPLTRQPQGNL